MEKKPSNIKLSLRSVVSLQFAVIEQSYHEDSKVKFQYGVKFEKVNDKKLIVVYAQTNFANESPFLIHEINIVVSLDPESWDKFYSTEKDTLFLPGDLALHLAGIAISTLRGSLNSKTEGTIFNRFLLPLVNINSIVVLEDGQFSISNNAELLDS